MVFYISVYFILFVAVKTNTMVPNIQFSPLPSTNLPSSSLNNTPNLPEATTGKECINCNNSDLVSLKERRVKVIIKSSRNESNIEKENVEDIDFSHTTEVEFLVENSRTVVEKEIISPNHEKQKVNKTELLQPCILAVAFIDSILNSQNSTKSEGTILEKLYEYYKKTKDSSASNEDQFKVIYEKLNAVKHKTEKNVTSQKPIQHETLKNLKKQHKEKKTSSKTKVFPIKPKKHTYKNLTETLDLLTSNKTEEIETFSIHSNEKEDVSLPSKKGKKVSSKKLKNRVRDKSIKKPSSVLSSTEQEKIEAIDAWLKKYDEEEYLNPSSEEYETGLPDKSKKRVPHKILENVSSLLSSDEIETSKAIHHKKKDLTTSSKKKIILSKPNKEVTHKNVTTVLDLLTSDKTEELETFLINYNETEDLSLPTEEVEEVSSHKTQKQVHHKNIKKPLNVSSTTEKEKLKVIDADDEVDVSEVTDERYKKKENVSESFEEDNIVSLNNTKENLQHIDLKKPAGSLFSEISEAVDVWLKNLQKTKALNGSSEEDKNGLLDKSEKPVQQKNLKTPSNSSSSDKIKNVEFLSTLIMNDDENDDSGLSATEGTTFFPSEPNTSSHSKQTNSDDDKNVHKANSTIHKKRIKLPKIVPTTTNNSGVMYTTERTVYGNDITNDTFVTSKNEHLDIGTYTTSAELTSVTNIIEKESTVKNLHIENQNSNGSETNANKITFITETTITTDLPHSIIYQDETTVNDDLREITKHDSNHESKGNVSEIIQGESIENATDEDSISKHKSKTDYKKIKHYVTEKKDLDCINYLYEKYPLIKLLLQRNEESFLQQLPTLVPVPLQHITHVFHHFLVVHKISDLPRSYESVEKQKSCKLLRILLAKLFEDTSKLGIPVDNLIKMLKAKVNDSKRQPGNIKERFLSRILDMSYEDVQD